MSKANARRKVKRSMAETVGNWFLPVLAAGAILLALGLAARSVYQWLTYSRSPGNVRVVGHGNKGSTYFEISFSAGGQQTIEEKDALSWLGGSSLQSGGTVEVMYPANAPAQGMVSSFKNLWLGPLIIFLIGMGLGIPSLFVLLKRRDESTADDSNLTAEELIALGGGNGKRKPRGKAGGRPGRPKETAVRPAATKPCPFCGTDLPGYAQACPHCKKVFA